MPLRNRNILKLPKYQSFFSAEALHVIKIPWSISNPDLKVYYDVIKLNAISNGNKYSLLDRGIVEGDMERASSS